jgi:hypothetical protein
MKKTLLFLSILLTSTIGIAQCPGVLNITTQEEIDDFLTTYPNCDGTGLFLDINGQNSNINNLQGLSHLTTIGTLGIFYTQLTDFSGLENLTTTTRLRILGNFDLINFNGLESLQNVGFGGFRIVLNSSLVSLQGLNGLTEVNGSFNIEVNNALETLEGLNNLTKVGGSFEIKSQQSLINLTALSSLEEVGTISADTFYIYNSPLVESLAGLENLRLVNGTLRLRFLNNITSLAALSELEVVTNEINLQYNAQLSFCGIDLICNYLDNNNIELIFFNNALGCSSLQEVEASCLLSIDEVDLDSVLILYPNPVSEILQIQTSETIVLQKITVYSLLGEELVITSEAWIDFSNFSAGIYFVEIATESENSTRKIVKE